MLCVDWETMRPRFVLIGKAKMINESRMQLDETRAESPRYEQ